MNTRDPAPKAFENISPWARRVQWCATDVGSDSSSTFPDPLSAAPDVTYGFPTLRIAGPLAPARCPRRALGIGTGDASKRRRGSIVDVARARPVDCVPLHAFEVGGGGALLVGCKQLCRECSAAAHGPTTEVVSTNGATTRPSALDARGKLGGGQFGGLARGGLTTTSICRTEQRRTSHIPSAFSDFMKKKPDDELKFETGGRHAAFHEAPRCGRSVCRVAVDLVHRAVPVKTPWQPRQRVVDAAKRAGGAAARHA